MEKKKETCMYNKKKVKEMLKLISNKGIVN